MQYNVTEVFENGMIKKLPKCQIDDCTNDAGMWVGSDWAKGDGQRGRIFICLDHVYKRDLLLKEKEARRQKALDKLADDMERNADI